MSLSSPTWTLPLLTSRPTVSAPGDVSGAPSVRARMIALASSASVSDRFYIKEGDTGRSLVCVLEDSLGNVRDLTGCSVTFSMRKRGTTDVKVDEQPAQVVDPLAGTVYYSWGDADVAEAGVFQAEFVVTSPTGKRITYPSGFPPLDYILVFVQSPASTTE